MMPEKGSFIYEILLDMLHVIQAIHVQVLIVSQDEDHVRGP